MSKDTGKVQAYWDKPLKALKLRESETPFTVQTKKHSAGMRELFECVVSHFQPKRQAAA